MAVLHEIDGPVAIITLDRVEVANAIDRPTADELVAAFRRFDANDSLSVAVLTGAGGKFCAGTDLKAMREEGTPRASRVAADGDGPVGPTRMLLS
jgi:enoyl-CoA hydratase